MGSFSGSKSKTVSGPAAYTSPHVQNALDQTQDVVNANASNLSAIGNAAIGAYNAIAPSAFGSNPFLTTAQGNATTLGSRTGAYAGFGQGNPGDAALSSIAGGSGAIGASTIGTGADQSIAGGKYLNAQPSAGLYKDIIGGSQLNGNPYLQSVIDSTNADVSTAANRQFAARGLGAGISTPYASILSKSLAANEGGLRYQNYNDAVNRQLTAAGQSDAAFASERGFMDSASGRVLDASKANAANDLAAQQFNSGQRFDAAQAQGQLYNQNQTLGLNAQQADDQTKLAALGLVPSLNKAQYDGVDPALALLNAAAGIPYTGVNVLGQNVANLTGATNSSTSTSKGPGLGFSVLSGAAAGAGAAAAAASDRRLKRDIEKIDTLHDGLGVYTYDYVDPDRFGEGRQIGVMADEVAMLRPWALGPLIDGEYGSVDYSKLGGVV